MNPTAVLTPLPKPVAPARRPAGPLRAPLRAETAHPFFFDHPLDHLPGSLLVAGVLDLLTGAGHDLDADDRHLHFALTFTGFCDTGAEPVVRAHPPAGAEELWTVDIRDGGREICRGRVCLFDGTPRPRPDPRPGAAEPAPAAAGLVHRHREENIVVGAPRVTPDAVAVSILTPAGTHYLGQAAPGVHGVRTLIEAARQFTTLLGLTVTGMPMDSRLIWLDVAADLPTGIPLGAPLELSWRRERMPGSRQRFEFDLVRADLPGEPLGTVVSSCAVLDEDTFAVLRNSGAGR